MGRGRKKLTPLARLQRKLEKSPTKKKGKKTCKTMSHVVTANIGKPTI